MEVCGQLHAPARLPPGKEPLVPIGKEAEWVQNGSGALVWINISIKYCRTKMRPTHILNSKDRKPAHLGTPDTLTAAQSSTHVSKIVTEAQ